VKALVTVAVLLAGTLAPVPAQAGSTAAYGVVPIAWQRFQAGLPGDEQAERTRAILLNANKYALRTWFASKYGSQTGEYLNLGGTAEGNVRPPGSEALALATSLATGAYDESVVGFPAAHARDVATRVVSSIAYHHVSNEEGGWGLGWQSALWAFNAAFAGWLLWDDLPAADRERLARMVRAEADAFLYYPVPYYQDPNGKVITPGDSKAEENAWNAAFLNLAVAMMPADPDRAVWRDKAIELMISAYSRPSDQTDTTEVNGKPVAQWLHGSNIFPDGTLVNHSIIHPDYFTSIANDAGAPLAYGLAGLPTPKAAFFNADVVYDALVNHEFSSPPYAAPGGTSYVRGPDGAASATIYYPQGNDWGTSRQMHFLLLDTLAATFGFGSSAPDWAAAHAQRALQMQSRFQDGRTYGAAAEDTYAGREEWVALLAGRTYLTHWLAHNADLRVTNQAYPVTPADYPGAVISMNTAPAYPVGVATGLSITLQSRSAEALKDLSPQLSLPSGWQAVRTDNVGTTVPPGASVTLSWSVTAPPSGVDQTVQVGAAVRYKHHGRQRQLSARASVAVPPGVNIARGKPVTVSSALRSTSGGDKAVDGLFTDDSRWISAETDAAPVLTVDLGAPAKLDSVYVYSGYQRTNNDPTTMLKDFTVQVHTGAGWRPVASVVDNTQPRVTIRSVDVTADQVRLSISDPSRSTTDVARVFEVEVYAKP
jgi:F5/8 type C domain/NPCBM-associated, NEW3 domain of alpha-galactosidase